MDGGPIRIGVSACLLGQKVRYDGRHKHDPYLTGALGPLFEWVPVCPEVECGLPVPREAMRLVGDPAQPRLVTIDSGTDHTDRMRIWAEERLRQIESLGLRGFVLKRNSPSCGTEGVAIHDAGGRPIAHGAGCWARALAERFPGLPAVDEERLKDPAVLAWFVEGARKGAATGGRR